MISERRRERRRRPARITLVTFQHDVVAQAPRHSARRFPGHHRSVPIPEPAFSDGPELLDGQLVDVSRHGIFVRTELLQPAGAEVAFEVAGRQVVGRVLRVETRPPKGPGVAIAIAGEDGDALLRSLPLGQHG